MTDTLFADVSEFQRTVDDTYPHRIISIRSNDGTYQDKNFAANLKWCKSAIARGRLDGFIIYFVWHPNWQAGVSTLQQMVGVPHPKMAVMIDVESWGGKITGNQSDGINRAREAVIAWLGGNRKRVIGYANAGDFANLWPSRGDARVILANYSSNPPFPNKIAHQFSSSYTTPPFGPCDINSADGYTPQTFAVALGIAVDITKPAPRPPAPTIPTALPEGVQMPGYLHHYHNVTGKPWKGVYLVRADLSSKTHITEPQSLAYLVSTKLYPTSGLSDAQVDSIPTAK